MSSGPADAARWRATDILLVEDETIVAMMIEDLLRELGCSVWPASNVQAALRLLDGRRPRAAILDVNLGDELAFPIAERLRAERIPFLFTTGYGRSALLGDWSDCIVLQKPFDPGALQNALAHILFGNAVKI